MKITEIVNKVYSYAATLRAKRGNSPVTVKTVIFANGLTQARALLAAMYGDDAVVSITRITDSQLQETVPNGTKPMPVPKVLPTKYKSDIVQHTLLNQMKRNALRVKPTVDELRAAQHDFQAMQKRVNREYEDAVKAKAKWGAIRKRRWEKFFSEI